MKTELQQVDFLVTEVIKSCPTVTAAGFFDINLELIPMVSYNLYLTFQTSNISLIVEYYQSSLWVLLWPTCWSYASSSLQNNNETDIESVFRIGDNSVSCIRLNVKTELHHLFMCYLKKYLVLVNCLVNRQFHADPFLVLYRRKPRAKL